MTLGELRDALKELEHLPSSTELIIQKDAEGNGYSPLDGLAEGWYEAETTWSGDAIHDDDYDPEDYPDAVRVVYLCPVN